MFPGGTNTGISGNSGVTPPRITAGRMPRILSAESLMVTPMAIIGAIVGVAMPMAFDKATGQAGVPMTH